MNIIIEVLVIMALIKYLALEPKITAWIWVAYLFIKVAWFFLWIIIKAIVEIVKDKIKDN